MRRRFLLALALLLATFQIADAQTRLVAIVLDFPTSIPTDATFLQYIRDVNTEVDAFTTNENSYGLAPQVTDVVGPFVVDDTAIKAAAGMSGAQFEIAKAGQAAALANGVDLTLYAWQGLLGSTCHCVYLYPDGTASGGGFGNLAGVWIGGAFGRTWPPGFQILAHEEGHHLFRLNHAHAIRCDDGSPGLTCPRGVSSTNDDYGDNYDVMGQGDGQFHNITKAALGWLTLTPMDHDGDYLLSPLEASTGVRGLTFRGGRKGVFTYVLEYRQPVGHDADQPWADPRNVFNGVLVRWASANAASPSGIDGNVLRMNRDAPDAYGNVRNLNQAALLVGQSVCDKDTHSGIAVLGTSPTGAVVRYTSRCR